MAKRDTNSRCTVPTYIVYRAENTRRGTKRGAAQQPRAATLHNRGRKLSVFLHASYAHGYRETTLRLGRFLFSKIPRICCKGTIAD